MPLLRIWENISLVLNFDLKLQVAIVLDIHLRLDVDSVVCCYNFSQTLQA